MISVKLISVALALFDNGLFTKQPALRTGSIGAS
jgi:hypothetical protein